MTFRPVKFWRIIVTWFFDERQKETRWIAQREPIEEDVVEALLIGRGLYKIPTDATWVVTVEACWASESEREREEREIRDLLG